MVVEKKVVLALNLCCPNIALELRSTKSMLSLYQARASDLSQQLTAFVSVHIHTTLGICSSTEGHLHPE